MGEINRVGKLAHFPVELHVSGIKKYEGEAKDEGGVKNHRRQRQEKINKDETDEGQGDDPGHFKIDPVFIFVIKIIS
jgi:hypothetical protein